MTASGIAARSGETTKIGSTEGKSPTAESGDAQKTPIRIRPIMTHSFKPEVVEKVARAIWVAEGHDEQMLYQHEEFEDLPVDERHEYTLSGEEKRVMLLHYGWRKRTKQAQAALSIPEIAALYEALEEAKCEVALYGYTTVRGRRVRQHWATQLLERIDKALTLCRKEEGEVK